MTYTIYPMVVGTKVFDKGMMTYQHDYGLEHTIPIYSWYIKGGGQNILVDTGERSGPTSSFPCTSRSSLRWSAYPLHENCAGQYEQGNRQRRL